MVDDGVRFAKRMLFFHVTGPGASSAAMHAPRGEGQDKKGLGSKCHRKFHPKNEKIHSAERLPRYQQLVGEQLSDFIKLLAVVNGLKGSVRNFVLLNLHGGSSFGDLDSLLARYVDIDQHESSLDNLEDRACTDKPATIGKGKGKDPIPSFKQQLEQGGKAKEGSATCQKGKGKSKLHKGKGEAYSPQPPAYKGKGKHAQLPTRKKRCNICWKHGHSTQACWLNSSNQQQQQHHQQPQAWYYPSISSNGWHNLHCRGSSLKYAT